MRQPRRRIAGIVTMAADDWPYTAAAPLVASLRGWVNLAKSDIRAKTRTAAVSKAAKAPARAKSVASAAKQGKPAVKKAAAKAKPAAKKVATRSASAKDAASQRKAAVKPTRTRAKAKVSRVLDAAAQLRALVLGALGDLKAKDVQEVDVRGKSSVTDLLVVASGTSSRHVKSIADEVVKKAKQAGQPPIGVEGQREAEWVLVDLGDVIVHVMLPRTREFYGLERLWTVGDDEAPAVLAG